jgi:hypothetical protein
MRWDSWTVGTLGQVPWHCKGAIIGSVGSGRSVLSTKRDEEAHDGTFVTPGTGGQQPVIRFTMGRVVVDIRSPITSIIEDANAVSDEGSSLLKDSFLIILLVQCFLPRF